MNEITKTSIFIAIAVVLFLLAWLVQPRERAAVTEDMVGKILFENFQAPTQIKELQIVKYLPETGDLVDFRVADVNGKWCLPSHQNYPADADEQMGRVAAGFIDQKVLNVAYRDTGSDDVRKMHETYGVVDPSSKGLGSGESVGVKAIITGESKRTLAALIIGKEVEDTGGMHSYVRVPEQNTVYVMAINKGDLSTKFDDWIEKNLLDISSFDLKSVRMQDYSTDMIETNQGIMMAPIFHSFFNVNYDPMSIGDKWQLEILRREDPKTQELVNVVLAPEEMLNEKKLEEMRQAFDDLKIIDVLRKPEAVAAAQREGELFVRTTDDIEILQNIGFMQHISQTPDGMTGYSIFSRQGRASIVMKDGIVYNLMFGNLTGTSIAENAEKPAADSAGLDPIVDAATDASSQETGGASATANVLSANRYLMIMAEFDDSIVDKPAPVPLPDVPEEGDEEEIARIKKQREDIELANKRNEDEYNNVVDAGQRRAKELNMRFADWFFVISDDVFKKIHVTDSELIIRPGEPLKNPDRDAVLDQAIATFGEMVDAPEDDGEIEMEIVEENIDLPQEEQNNPSDVEQPETP